MPSSLEPLSSPSPSLSPSPPPQDTRASTSNNSGAGAAGLDSGSDLSDLTEDEQEDTVKSKSQADREERGIRPSRRGRKRGGIVPAPMWDWAYKNSTKKDWKTRMLEDEDEDHPGESGLPVEDEELDAEEEGRVSRSRTGTSPPSERRRNKRKASGPVPGDEDDEDEEPEHPSDIDEEDQASVAATSVHMADDALNDPDYVSDEDEVQPTPAVAARDARGSGSGGGSPEATDDENADEEDAEVEPDPDRPDDPEIPGTIPAEEYEDEEEDLSTAKVGPAASLPTPAGSILAPSVSVATAVDTVEETDTTMTLMDVDESAPPAEAVSPIIAAAAASSIMAGSVVIDAPSPSPSTSSAASGSARIQSPASSRSPSPEPRSDRETETKRGTARTRGKPRASRQARNKPRRRLKADTVAEQDAELEQNNGDVDDREDDFEEGDVDSAEIDIELDLQPAHRAEALDVLASIELKYALLRESLYVEKMEALAWEESLIAEGIHPEMLHLQTELSKRRDKRLELASRRRDFEVSNVTKRRKLAEDDVWSWWKLRRDELQTDMIAETNRTRRKLDRERRVIDRPPPVRRIPSPPRELPRPPTLQELVKSSPFDSVEYRKQQLADSALVYPQLSALPPMDIANDLEFLNTHRRNYINMDGARAGIINMNPLLPGHPTPGPMGYEQLNMGLGIGMVDVTGGNTRFPTHLPYQQPMPPGFVPGQMVQGYPGPVGAPGPAPRLQHHHSAPPTSLSTARSVGSMMFDQEGATVNRPGAPVQFTPNAPPFVGNLMRRSISPVAVQATTGSQSSVLGGVPSPNKVNGRPGLHVAGPSSINSKEPKRVPSNIEAEGFDRDKERFPEGMKANEKDIRDRQRDVIGEPRREQQFHDRELDRARVSERDREYDRDLDRVPLTLQRHQSHQLPPHVPNSHHHAPHHHHHHHHHVHHHHHPNSTNAQSPNINGQTAGSALHPSNGFASRNPSPHPSREPELRRPHSGAPVEVIELSSKPSASASIPSWRGFDELISADTQERGRSTHTPSHDRGLPPNRPSSPRNPPGPSTAPASMAPSRRGSWSAPDDANLPRPLSSASSSVPTHTMLGSHRVTSASTVTGRQQVSPPTSSHRSPQLLSSPRHGSTRPAPLSPPSGPISHSPLRVPQTLSPVTNPLKPNSPHMLRRNSPPLTGRPKSPRDMHHTLSGGLPPLSSPPKHAAPSSPSLFTSSMSHSSLIAPHPDPPKVNTVPID